MAGKKVSIFLATTIVFVAIITLMWTIKFLGKFEDDLLVDKETFTACALFTVYGTSPRYVNEVESSIETLKSRNHDVKVILATNNARLNAGTSPADHVEAIESVVTGFLSRTLLISEMHQRVPECHFIASMDSHVKVCSNNLKEKLYDLYRAKVMIGTNIEHAPFKPWCSSPFQYEQYNPCGSGFVSPMPHNFVIVWNPHSAAFKELARVWIEIHRKDPHDDQKPLQKALQKSGVKHTRLQENFALALKRLHHKNIGFYPRFTYLFEGNVTMIHSHTISSIPRDFKGDVCKFLNSEIRPRMIVEASKGSKYEFIHSSSECEEKFHVYPNLCNDTGLMYASKW